MPTVDVSDGVPGVTVDGHTININGNIVTLTLSWGEPFNNFDPIVNYTVSCSGDVTCPPYFTTTDNTTRSYTITNLTTMTTYTFSVVATILVVERLVYWTILLQVKLRTIESGKLSFFYGN